MALRTIELRGSSSAPTVTQRVSLDGVDYLLELQWNAREGRWFMHLFDASGAPIALGVKLVADARIAKRATDPRMPQGRLAVVDSSGTSRDPGIDDLADRVALVYLDAADAGGSA